MHPAISQFPSDLFYAGRIADGIEGSARSVPAGFAWPRPDWPVAFIPVLHGREVAEGVSRYNAAEAEEVVRVVNGLLAAGMAMGDVGIVTPYAAQVRHIRRLFPRPGPGERGVEVSSVDGFQGREKEVILMSTVRSSASGGVGFLADWRRVNVAFTRPRSGLIVLGNPDTLSRDTDTWGRWLQWVAAHGVNTRDPVPRGHLDRAALQAVAPARNMMPQVAATEVADFSEGRNGMGWKGPGPGARGGVGEGGGGGVGHHQYHSAYSSAYGMANGGGGGGGGGVAALPHGLYPQSHQMPPQTQAAQQGSTMAALMSGDWNALMVCVCVCVLGCVLVCVDVVCVKRHFHPPTHTHTLTHRQTHTRIHTHTGLLKHLCLCRPYAWGVNGGVSVVCRGYLGQLGGYPAAAPPRQPAAPAANATAPGMSLILGRFCLHTRSLLLYIRPLLTRPSSATAPGTHSQKLSPETFFFLRFSETLP